MSSFVLWAPVSSINCLDKSMEKCHCFVVCPIIYAHDIPAFCFVMVIISCIRALTLLVMFWFDTSRISPYPSELLYWDQGNCKIALKWRHNERHGVSNHQPHDCLLNRLFRRRSKKKSKLRTGLCAGNSPVTGEFHAQRASNAENDSTWWRHHW